MNLRPVNGGSLRPRATPTVFSRIHRDCGFAIAQLASGLIRPASAESVSTRERSQRSISMLFAAWWAAFSSITIAGMSTPAAQSVRH